MDKFDVEVFEIQTDANGIESYISMKFAKEIKYVDDNNFNRFVNLRDFLLLFRFLHSFAQRGSHSKRS